MPTVFICALAGVAVALALSQPVLARGVADDVGLTELQARLGIANTPTGAGVVVAQVEGVDPPSSGNYGPNQADSEFTGKTFVATGLPPGNSPHATLVAQNMYGNATSIAPGISNIYLFEAGAWVTSGYLRTGQAGAAPLPTPGGIKVFNNSWIASFGAQSTDNDCLRRADYVVDRDELIIVNGMNNGGPQTYPLMVYSFNGISVGLAGGTHSSGTVPAGYDGANRMKPEIVAPSSATSFAAPIIDAAAALMVETVNSHSNLVLNPNARRSETLKAILLCGATHRDGWTNNPATSGPNRGATATPLDAVYGVDLVNVNRSHLILTGLEQTPTTTPPATTTVLRRGWDLATVPSGSQRYYRFHVGSPAGQVSILATWHRVVTPTATSFTMANFNLLLWRVNAQGQLTTLVGDAGLPYFADGNVVSQSAVDNLEHLYITDLQPGDYVIEIERADALATNADVAVAWLLPKRAGDVDGDGFVNVSDLLSVVSAWGACPPPCLPSCPADLNGDCNVNVTDLLEVVANWG